MTTKISKKLKIKPLLTKSEVMRELKEELNRMAQRGGCLSCGAVLVTNKGGDRVCPDCGAGCL